LSKILCAEYNETFVEKANYILASLSKDVVVQVWNPEEVDKVKNSDIQVIMARGGTASRIRNTLSIPVVEIPIPFEDMVETLIKASEYGRNIVVIGYNNLLKGLDLLNPILNVNITQLFAENEQDTYRQIQEISRQNVDVIVGGAAQTRIANKLGIHNVIIDMSEKALKHAYYEAANILDTITATTRKAEEIKTILNTTKEGYIAVNAGGTITLANNKAYQLAPGLQSAMEGMQIEQLFPEFSNIYTVLEKQYEITQQISSIKNKEIIYDMIPLVHKKGKEIFGAVISFNDISTITMSEQKIRGWIKRGFYAHYTFDSIMGHSTAIQECVRIAQKYAKTDSSVLILGETGVGKEMFAQSIHNFGARKEGPFLAVNCATLPESILESELFGYEAGAFTDAKKGGKAGLFELAHQGTIFLDEISEMPLALQSRLLRVLQERKVMRLGGDRVIPVDIKVIAATNNNLMEMARKNQFRSDLFYRLNVLTVAVPPLRNREEDVVLLANSFLKQFDQTGKRQLSDNALKELQSYGWPGNVRQLKHFIEKLQIISDAPIITGSITNTVINNYEPRWEAIGTEETRSLQDKPILSKEEVEKALLIAGGSKTQAAEILGVHRATLWRFMKKHFIS